MKIHALPPVDPLACDLLRDSYTPFRSDLNQDAEPLAHFALIDPLSMKAMIVPIFSERSNACIVAFSPVSTLVITSHYDVSDHIKGGHHTHTHRFFKAKVVPDINYLVIERGDLDSFTVDPMNESYDMGRYYVPDLPVLEPYNLDMGHYPEPPDPCNDGVLDFGEYSETVVFPPV